MRMAAFLTILAALVLAVLASLALPALSRARAVDLSRARGELAVRRYLRHDNATIEACSNPRRGVVSCDFTMPDPDSPGWTFHYRAVARLHVRSLRISVSLPGWDTQPFSEPL